MDDFIEKLGLAFVVVILLMICSACVVLGWGFIEFILWLTSK